MIENLLPYHWFYFNLKYTLVVYFLYWLHLKTVFQVITQTSTILQIPFCRELGEKKEICSTFWTLQNNRHFACKKASKESCRLLFKMSMAWDEEPRPKTTNSSKQFLYNQTSKMRRLSQNLLVLLFLSSLNNKRHLNYIFNLLLQSHCVFFLSATHCWQYSCQWTSHIEQATLNCPEIRLNLFLKPIRIKLMLSRNLRSDLIYKSIFDRDEQLWKLEYLAFLWL